MQQYLMLLGRLGAPPERAEYRDENAVTVVRSPPLCQPHAKLGARHALVLTSSNKGIPHQSRVNTSPRCSVSSRLAFR